MKIVAVISTNALTNTGQKSGEPDHDGAVRNTGIVSIYRRQTLENSTLGKKSAAINRYRVGTARSRILHILQRSVLDQPSPDWYRMGKEQVLAEHGSNTHTHISTDNFWEFPEPEKCERGQCFTVYLEKKTLH